MEISKCLKDARQNKNITQEELAEKLGVSRQTISSWENGKSYPDIGSLIKMSDLFSISLDKLLKEDKKLVNSLQNNADTAKSNKAVFFTIGLAIIVYGGIYLLRTFVDIPKIDNIWLNLIVSGFFFIGTVMYIFSNINVSNFLNKKTSNKTLFKVIITALMIISLVCIFPFLDKLSDSAALIFISRLGLALFLSFVSFLIFKKIDKY